MKVLSTVATFVAIIFSSSLLQASEKTTIYIDVIGNAKFDVIYHRASSNSTGAAFGGLIGAGIQAGVESSKDATKVKEIKPLIDQNSWDIYFLETLNSKLASKNHVAKWSDENSEITEGFVLKLYPDNYGFKIVDTTTMLMSAYVEFEALLTNLDSNKLEKKQKKKRNGIRKGTRRGEEIEKKSFYVTSRDRRTYEDFASDKVVLNSDLQSALKKAAKRIANKIIYNKDV